MPALPKNGASAEHREEFELPSQTQPEQVPATTWGQRLSNIPLRQQWKKKLDDERAARAEAIKAAGAVRPSSP